MKDVFKVVVLVALFVSAGGCAALQEQAEAGRLVAEANRTRAESEARQEEVAALAAAEQAVAAAEANRAQSEAVLEQAAGDRAVKEAVAEQVASSSRTLQRMTWLLVFLAVIFVVGVLVVLLLLFRWQALTLRQYVQLQERERSYTVIEESPPERQIVYVTRSPTQAQGGAVVEGEGRWLDAQLRVKP
jgi:hypothetical protein